ncbi:kunitz-type protease inhibitor 1-like [Boleophthalmus pectinirostris]|uniref:kunitz-type protease inhibitor 1-like n=1 Tax=Boleophthalmus pectinirostris TaxID=150288 RepID=UPI00242C9018|nr:kunitz-type protease inhibitor 1-like [Boleophthalmus pectinirostris]
MLLLVLRVLPLVVAVRRGGAADAACADGYRADFVLDAEEAVKQGAVLLNTAHAQNPEECERACCEDPLCNLALVEPNGACALFDCVYRNRFVCNRFQSRDGYLTYVTAPLYRDYLKAPPRKGEQRRPIAVGGRDLVVQPGETVVLNGTESHAIGAEITDYSWTLLRGNGTVIMQTTEYPDQVRVSGLGSGSYWFQLTVTDSHGLTATDEILVQVLTPEQSSLFCLAAVKVGPCRASFVRWRYDAASTSCSSFIYGGCKGNYNNFLSRDACETACRGVTVALARNAPPPVNALVFAVFCLAAVKVGPCRASFVRWRYDAASTSCSSFIYGGCKGNYNNFLSRDACETACRGVTVALARNAPPPVNEVCGSVCAPGQLLCDSSCCVHKSLECDGVTQCADGADESGCKKLNETFNRLVKIEVDDKKARCTLPPHTGPCRASFTRWFYDPLDQKCQSFTFGGCDANENNHEQKDECENSCKGVTEEDVYAPAMFKRFGEEEEEYQSGSIALAVILTVALLALLTMGAYCFLKRRKDHIPVPNVD